MAKQRPARAGAKGRKTAATSRAKAPARPAIRRRPTRTTPAQRASKTPVGSPKAPDAEVALDPAPALPSRKPSFYEAVAIYERGVQGLQRHDYHGAADLFRAVIERYPAEQELIERATLYLRVCERETARRPAPPRTPAERVYAATLALNSGDHAMALEHLQSALSEDAENDHAHYAMAVTLGMRGRLDEALDYLRNAISLNPENRSLALQDPDLEPLKGHKHFPDALDAPPVRRRTKPRR